MLIKAVYNWKPSEIIRESSETIWKCFCEGSGFHSTPLLGGGAAGGAPFINQHQRLKLRIASAVVLEKLVRLRELSFPLLFLAEEVKIANREWSAKVRSYHIADCEGHEEVRS